MRPVRDRLTAATIYKGRQDWSLESLWQLGEFRVRVRVRRDAYDFQCKLITEVWSVPTLSWNGLVSLPFEAAPKDFKELSYVSDDKSRAEACLVLAEAEILKHAAITLGVSS